MSSPSSRRSPSRLSGHSYKVFSLCSLHQLLTGRSAHVYYVPFHMFRPPFLGPDRYSSNRTLEPTQDKPKLVQRIRETRLRTLARTFCPVSSRRHGVL